MSRLLLSEKRERRAVRVHALRDAFAAGNVHRAVPYLAVALLDASECGVEIRDRDVVEPVRRRWIALRLRHHPTEGAATFAVHLVGAQPSLKRVSPLPAEQLRAVAEH